MLLVECGYLCVEMMQGVYDEMLVYVQCCVEVVKEKFEISVGEEIVVVVVKLLVDMEVFGIYIGLDLNWLNFLY